MVADCGVTAQLVESYDVGAKFVASYNVEKAPTPLPTEKPAPAPVNQEYSIIISSRPNVGRPDYALHPAFVKPGLF